MTVSKNFSHLLDFLVYLKNIQATIASNRTTSVSAFSTAESNYDEDEEPEYAELIGTDL